MDDSFCIAAAQTCSIAGDLEHNVQRHCAQVRLAAEQGVQLLLFPELSLSGYEPKQVAKCTTGAQDPRLAPLHSLAQRHDMTLVLGAPLDSGTERPHIGALVLFPDGSHSHYHKRHLHTGEERWSTEGQADSALVRVAGRNAALAICADITHPEHALAAARNGADLYLAGVLLSKQGYAADMAHLQRYSAEHGYAVLLSNHGAPSGGYDAAGRSAFWAPGGQLLAATDGPGEHLLVVRQRHGEWTASSFAVAPY